MIYFFYFLVAYAVLILISAYDFRNAHSDYLIILGKCLVDNRETFALIRRVDRAAFYLQRNPECVAVVSGGISKGNTVSEAAVMYQMLLDRHINRDRIILEDRSQNTLENMLYSKELIDINKKICVCSNDYHILRAKLLAQKFGYRVHSIFVQSTMIEYLIHLPLEEYYIIRDLFFTNRS